jgi:2-oxoglutarate ferredoxin oxidoreductase subunit beta
VTAPGALTRKDFVSDQEVRWCPGCGDYAILSATQQLFPELGVPRERLVIVSGIGCSSRFPYYMNTYGFHTIHGRAPSVATGIKLANPELTVWIVTGDGDALSIGGNHIIHVLRRNVDLKILLFDNRIYGLTKGQYSPTSEVGKRTKSTPYGSIDPPFSPALLALGAGATFVARSIDVHATHLRQTMKQAHEHRGTAFIQVYQNCNIFNDGAFENMRDKALRAENVLELAHGQPMRFGRDGERGIRLGPDGRPQVVQLGGAVSESDLLIHDEAGSLAYAAMLATMQPPNWPTPIGVLRRVQAPSFDSAMHRQIQDVTGQRGPGSLHAAIHSGGTWEVR